MAFPVSLSGGEVAIFMGLGLILVMVAGFVALFVSTVVALGIGRVVYLVGNCCFKRVRGYAQVGGGSHSSRWMSAVSPSGGR